jgi:prepilin-type N-terminal cleavage/methylation domain-containing protein
MNYRGPMQTSSNKGFTLVELLVGMIISTIVLGVAFMMFENASKSYSNDKVRVDAGQGLTAILDLIGTDIKQAGEQIDNAKFPTVKISDGGKTISIRRALTDALTICQSLAATDALLTTGNNATDVLIGDSTLPTTPTPPSSCSTSVSIPDWLTGRTDLGGTGRVALVKSSGDFSGQAKILDYTGESPDPGYATNNKYKLSLKNTQLTDIDGTNISPATIESPVTTTPVANYVAGDRLYLIEERTYRYHVNPADPKDIRLLLRVNGGDEQVLVSGLETDGFSVTANINPPSPPSASPSPSTSASPSATPSPPPPPSPTIKETTFPNPVATSSPSGSLPNNEWKKIAGVSISLKLKKPSSCTSNNQNGCKPEDFETSGTFYPRNVMSK